MLLLALAACDPTPPDADSSDRWEDPDGNVLEADAAGLRWRRADGTTVAVELLLVEAAAADFAACSYDPWFLYDERSAAGTLATAGFEADLSEHCSQGLGFWASEGVEAGRVHFTGGRSAALSVDATGPGLRVTVVPDEGELAVPWLGVRVGVGGDEGFYGLGETFDQVEHRGRVRPMQIEIDLGRESAYNEVHVPVPLLVSDASWGLLVDSLRPATFDVAATRDDAVTALVQQLGEGLTFDLYAPPEPALVTGRYWQRTGAPEVPPDWAFAPLHWRNENESGEQLLDDARTLRELGLATGVVWVDNPWQTSYNSMQPDPARFPDWDAMVEELHALGFRLLAWTTPYVEEADPEFASYTAKGWLVDQALLFNQFGKLVDLTHPDAMAAWTGRASAAQARGIEGWKLDYGEDVQLGVAGNRLQGWTFADGSDERTLHHGFALRYHEAYAAADGGAGVLIGRGGALRGHTITDVIWPGDLDNGFERWDDEADGETLVGGLVSAIHGGAGLSVSGYPFFASDTGGYRGGRPTHEAFVRWMEYAAILPIWQYGGAGENHNPWDFTAYGGSQFTEETLEAFRRHAALHTRLWPYYQAAVARMLAEGRPIVLPRGLLEPGRGGHDETEFYVGDALFVAPVVDEGAQSWSGTLPDGEWVHWWTGERVSGAVTVDAPLGQGPLFQRAGSVVPLLRESVVTLAPTGAEGVDSWADDPGALGARIVPGAGAAATTVDGATIQADSAEQITVVAGSAYRGWSLEVYAPDAAEATVDGVPTDVAREGPWVKLELAPGGHTVGLR